MKKLLILCLFFSAFNSVAQMLDLPTDYIRNTLDGKNNLQKNVVGSPYLNDNFQPGTVTIADKSFNTYLRYNGLQDVFEIKNQAGEVNSLMRRPDIKVTLNGKNHEIVSYMDPNGLEKQRYFILLVDGNSMFLKNEGIEYKDAQQATSSYSQAKPAALVPYEKYYIKLNDMNAVEVSLKKNSILDAIDDDRIVDYVKKNKLKLKKEEEVIQLIQYFNSL